MTYHLLLHLFLTENQENSIESSPDSPSISPLNSPSLSSPNNSGEELFYTLRSLENELPMDLQRRTKKLWKYVIYLELSYLFLSSFILILALIISSHQPNAMHRPENDHNGSPFKPNHQLYRENNHKVFEHKMEERRQDFPPLPPQYTRVYPPRPTDQRHPSPPPPYRPEESQSSSVPATTFHRPPHNREHTWGCDNRDSRIIWWASGQVVLQSIMLIIGAILQWKLPSSDTEEISERRWKSIMSIYTFNRFSNLLWLVWTLLGIIWTFESQSCPKGNLLYYACFTLSICHLAFLSIPVLFCCCSVPFAYVRIIHLKRKAYRENLERIDSHTSKFKYEQITKEEKGIDGFIVRKEDANCPICLSDYEVSEDIRFLRCKHHFHGECIAEWLQQNNSCPMCKVPFDEQKEVI
eukprot:TRINITY_DN2232_c0_g1_i1.p1 TRINITY_DN2232_c0_g1~~TRINITY_DN2232_c0_g1_i1.p1  ORF type:complete len:410 (+),score=86.94 TRINITY_DN2232_c0_g1_i1:289-1518(+)